MSHDKPLNTDKNSSKKNRFFVFAKRILIGLLLIGIVFGSFKGWLWFEKSSPFRKVSGAASSVTSKPNTRQNSENESKKIDATHLKNFPEQKVALVYLNTLADELTLELSYRKRKERALNLAKIMRKYASQFNDDPVFRDLDSHLKQLIKMMELLPSINAEMTETWFTALHNSISELNLNLYPLKSIKEEDAERELSWREKFFEKLSSLIMIRHHETRPDPLLSPTQNFYLKINLDLLVTQTEIAIQTQDWNFAGHNVLLMREHLQNYFDLTTEDGKKVLNVLSQVESYIKNMQSEQQNVVLAEAVKINNILQLNEQNLE